MLVGGMEEAMGAGGASQEREVMCARVAWPPRFYGAALLLAEEGQEREETAAPPWEVPVCLYRPSFTPASRQAPWHTWNGGPHCHWWPEMYSCFLS